MKRFISEIIAFKKLLLLTIISIIGSTIAMLAAPYILGLTIDKYILPSRYSELPFIVSIYLLCLIGQWGFHTLRRYSIEALGQHVLYSLREKIFNKLLSAKISFYKDRQVGDLVSRLINDTSTINEVLVSGLLGVIGDVFSLIGIVVMMFILSPSLTLVAMVGVPLMIFIAWFFGSRLRRAYKAVREKIASLSSVVSENVSGIETIKAFGREDRVRSEFAMVSWETVRMYMRVAVLMGFFWPLMNLASTLSIVVVLIYGGYLSITGVLSIGVVVAFIQYVNRFIRPINNLISLYDSLQSALASLDRIYEVLDVDEIEEEAGIEINGIDGGIIFDHVWFEYEPGKPILKDINLEIKPGETIAIVGRTGAGKTTLINLLLRFYDPVKGRILVDGVELREIKRSSVRKHISYVPQETYLFPGTVLDNIRVGKPDASDEEVKRICRILGIEEFIEKLPKGYYTDAGEAGKRLSVGEKQLIAIARAMLRSPDVVVLDEALSSVDAKTEEIIRRAIKTLMKGRTGIIVAHRLTITHDCDRVIVIDDGRIVEEGRLEALLSRKGVFYKLYKSQISGIEALDKPVIQRS
ncbi:MAG: ABC transporter [Desulfurococcales archaeon ex4484_58]|nr:MAG: ABC transporter [Desulfurococcales archaeon ex4484_58]